MIFVEKSVGELSQELEALCVAEDHPTRAFALGAAVAVKWILEGTTKPSEFISSFPNGQVKQ